MVTLTLREIIRRLIFEHGLSGSGKGELQSEIQKQGEEFGVKVTTLSSGDAFRATKDQIRAIDPLQRTAEEEALANILNKGIIVPTLDLVRPALTQKLVEFIIGLAENENRVLVLDGFLRMGKYETKFQEEMRTVPSQILQVAAALDSAIRLAAAAGVQFDDGLDAFLVGDDIDLWEVEEEERLAEIAQEISRTATHLIANIPEKDAEALMRYRSLKEMRKLYQAIIEGGNRVYSDDLSWTLSAVNKIIHLEAGRFFIKDGLAIPILENDISIKPAHTSELEGFTTEEGEAVDLAVKNICNEMAARFEIEPKEAKVTELVSRLVLLTKKELGLNIGAGSVRDDDILFEYRLNRIGFFRDRTTQPVLADGLGLNLSVLPDGRIEVPTLPENVGLLQNGPSLGVDYSAFQFAAVRVARAVLVRLEGTRLVVGERAI